ncbi:MAG TPA: hypothetical protein VN905_02495 [Candidatus Binatia bacterium]|nr:hypothetical protein [Candidatus Binatia bacterium]
MQIVQETLAEELRRALIQGGRDLEYLLFIDSKRRTAEWTMRLRNLVAVIERARETGFADDEIRVAVSVGLFPELFGARID